MTDALGLGCSQTQPSAIPILRELETKEQFIELVEAARRTGDMRRDDSTLLVLGWE